MPDLVPTTIFLGPQYKELARLCARAFDHFTGVPLRLVELTPGEDPFRAKLSLLERFPGERILYLDADVIAVRPWSLDYEPGLWLAVEQSRAPGGRWNTGVWIAGPDEAPVFADALSRYDAGLRGGPRQDEPALTLAIEAAGVMPKVLSPFVNHQRRTLHENTIAIHLLGGTVLDKLHAARSLTSSLPRPARPPTVEDELAELDLPIGDASRVEVMVTAAPKSKKAKPKS